jgi:hypothetical protein
MVASMMFGISLFTHSLVPLHSFGGSRFLNNSIGDPTYKVKLCGGIPDGSNFRPLANCRFTYGLLIPFFVNAAATTGFPHIPHF